MNNHDYFEEYGAGPPIVFIHGSFASTSTWNKMVEPLTKTHRCILIKLPGHCGTPDPDDFDKPDINTELSILEECIKTLGIDEPIHLVGHSFGGVVALAQALKGNIPLQQLTLFEPVAVWVFNSVNDQVMQEEVKRFIVKYQHDAKQQVPDVCSQVIDLWGGAGSFATLPPFIKEAMGKLVENNLRHWGIINNMRYQISDLEQLTTPTQFICGSHSNPAARAIADHLCQHIPNSDKHCIEGASHFLVNTHIKECLQLLQAVLK